MKSYWGIDLGGTKIEGVVLDSLEKAVPLCRVRIDTEQSRGYEHVLRRVGQLIEQMTHESGLNPTIVGIGHPGVLDPETFLLKNSNTQCLNGMPFKSDLEKLIRIPTSLANDANCFALAETVYGAAKGAKTVFGVIMGTGVGGGIVVNREVIRGVQGIAGEWGHNVLLPDGPKCYCGKTGCVEALISGPALEAFYTGLSGSRCSLAEIVTRARAGTDVPASATLARLTNLFGRAIASVVNILDPDIIVLGGGLSSIHELYDNGRREAAQVVFNNTFTTPIVPNTLGDSAGVFGAAALTACSEPQAV